MVADSTPERLLPRWAQVLAALAHQVIALPVDKNKNSIQTENVKSNGLKDEKAVTFLFFKNK